jgi:sugar phosphate isomerase/epimerase
MRRIMPAPLALQLYTLRDVIDRDFEGTLRRVAELGYVGVETAFFAPEITHRQARAAISAAGLQICSIHCELPLGDQRAAVLDQAAALGAQRIVWHGWPEDPRYGTLDGIAELAGEYNAAAEAARSAGLTLGLHNHWWECRMIAGRRAYQHLLEQIDPAIFWELDTYWATVAGCDAPAVVRELGARAPLLHLKDGPATPDAVKQALGTGTIDVPAIIAASAGNAEWLIVELDDYDGDMFTAVAESATYMISNGLAVGRG